MSSSSLGSTSASLLERAKMRVQDAWRRLVRLYGPLVYAWRRKANLSKNDLDDVFQEVFAAASARLATFKKTQPGDTFRGWLRVVPINKVRGEEKGMSRI